MIEATVTRVKITHPSCLHKEYRHATGQIAIGRPSNGVVWIELDRKVRGVTELELFNCGEFSETERVTELVPL